MSLSKETIKKIARLSRLRLTDEELITQEKNLNAIFNWIDQLQQIDISSVNLDDYYQSSPMMHERPDQVTAPNRVSEILKNAPASKHDLFCVPKVVE